MADEPYFDPDEDAREFDRRAMVEAIRQLSEAAERAFASGRWGEREDDHQADGTAADAGGGLLAALEELASVIGDLQDEIAGLSESIADLAQVSGTKAKGGRAATPGEGGDKEKGKKEKRDDLGQVLEDILGKELADTLGSKDFAKFLRAKLGGKLGELASDLLGGGLSGAIDMGRAVSSLTAEAAGTGAAGASRAAVAKAGGPVAVAMFVDQVADRVISAQGEKLRGAIEGMTDAYKATITGDVEGLAKGGAEKVAGTLEGFGIGGKVMAENVRTATALTFAFKDLYDATIDAAKAQEQHNFELSKASAAMAMVEADKDVRTTFREMELGDRTAGSAADLTDSLQDLADNTKEIRVLFDSVKSTVLARLVDLFSAALMPIEQTAKAVNAIASHPLFRRFLPKEQQGGENAPRFDQIIRQIREAEAEARRHNDEWFRRSNDFGGQRRPGG